MIRLLSVLVFISQPAQAQNNPALCGAPVSAAYEQVGQMPQGKYAAWWPEFVRTRDGQTWAAIMCSNEPNKIVGGSNCLVKLGNPQSSDTFGSPGVYDGQWTKDPESEPLFTAPNKFRVPKGGLEPGLTFFSHKEVLEKGKKARPLFHDPVFGNHYHSFGAVDRGVDSQGKRYVVHRAMNDKWGASIRDYKAILDGNGNTVSVEALGPERNLTNGPGETEQIRKEPSNQADPEHHYSYYDLPMISADGRFFAVNNRKTMTAQIFEITPSGKRLVADLGFETGKISFAPPKLGSSEVKIAFHVDQVDPAEGDKMSSLHKGMTKDIVVMKLGIKKGSSGQTVLERKEASRITAAGLSGQGNYYPKWVSGNELIYIQSRNQRQSFVKVNVDLLKEHSHRLEAIGASECESCKQAKYEAVVALGKLFADSCTDFSQKISAREAQLYTLQLNTETCGQLAATWEAQKNKVLSAKELYSLRKSKTPGDQRVPGWNFPESYSKRGTERKEKPANRAEIEKITVSDLQAVCQALKK